MGYETESMGGIGYDAGLSSGNWGERAQSARETTHPADERLVSRSADERPTLSVVLPTLNEEGGIGECITRIKNALVEIDVTAEIIVSDSSTDRTPEIAAAMGAVVFEPDKPGYGYAYRYAFARAHGEYIAMGDADATYDFEELPKLFEPVARGEADMVLGTRLGGTMERGSMPALHRYIGNPLLTKFLNAFYKAGVSDAHSGFRVFSREAYESLDLQTDGMEFASEMIMVAGQRGLRMQDVPIVYHPRIGDAHLDSFRDGWRHVRFMLLNAPGYLFSVPAAAFVLVGALTLVLSFVGESVEGLFFGTHTAVAGSLLVIVGYQVGNLAVFSTVASDPVKRQRDPVTRWVTDRVSLERGATLGVALTALGGAYVVFLLWRWVASGYAHRPFVVADMLAFTAIVLGTQTVFYAFFLSMVRPNRTGETVGVAREDDHDAPLEVSADD